MTEENTYIGHIDPSDSGWASSEWTDLLKDRYHLASIFCRDKEVLDSCCGTGWGMVNYIAKVASSAVGFDIMSPTESAGNASCPCTFLTMNGLDMQFDDKSFDVVLALDSLEHFNSEDGAKYLQHLKRVCKDRGLIIGTTPLVPHTALIPFYLECNKYHRCMYTRISLRQRLGKSFPMVRIHEIHNRVLPYFLFLCAKTPRAFDSTVPKHALALPSRKCRKRR